MSEQDAESVVCDVIQRVYGDATQTALDHQAAREIVSALRQRGWVSLSEVAMLIEAAGGSVVIPDALVADTKERVVERHEDFAACGTRFTVRTR